MWISYNGKFLNPPPLSEIKKNDENEKKKEEEEEEVDEGKLYIIINIKEL